MFYLRGSAAVSYFRIERLLAKIAYIVPQITGLHAEYIHFIDQNEALSPHQTSILSDLLSYGMSLVDPIEPAGKLMLVVPRLGTVSSWSSKATDIAHQCGLNTIRRIERGIAYYLEVEPTKKMTWGDQLAVSALLHDEMTETVLYELSNGECLFKSHAPKQLKEISIENGIYALEEANVSLGLGLSKFELEYLLDEFSKLNHHPTDVELMMFAGIHSEHCRHKIFNSQWIIDGELKPDSLLSIMKNTYEKHATEPVQMIIKTETHNHPTAISPRVGAATGVGGEMRHESAAGRGGKPKAGLIGFSVSNLNIPGFKHSWEWEYGKPNRVASALEIMLEAPIGSAQYNNVFGRPTLCGYFRTYQQAILGADGPEVRGYHKPIMIAGGLGEMLKIHELKQTLSPGMHFIVLGGPAFLIGLGGSIAVSIHAGSDMEGLDFALIQRDNPEMQRRCQEVIDACCRMGVHNPIVSMRSVGSGGLANAVSELLYTHKMGGRFQIKAIPTADLSLSPLELWCNEAQERFIVVIHPDAMPSFSAIARREGCPFAVIGEVLNEPKIIVEPSDSTPDPVHVPIALLFGEWSRLRRKVDRRSVVLPALELPNNLYDMVFKLLRLPVIADKSFLITMTDRSVTGLVARDPMVGPWQVPVSDCGVTAESFQGYRGEAMAMGERSPIALINAAASARMAVAEAITNIVAAHIASLSDVHLSANWMAACGFQDEDAKLYDAVQAIGVEFCAQLGLSIPAGKDSLSMQTVWFEEGKEKRVASPLSLVVSAFSKVVDIRKTLTPQLRTDVGNTILIFIDLSSGNQRLGGSAIAQVMQQVGNLAPDVDDPKRLQSFFTVIQRLNAAEKILAYHDRSDGGLFVTFAEMAFASHVGIQVQISALGNEPASILFNEELGAVIQVKLEDLDTVLEEFSDYGLIECHPIASVDQSDYLTIVYYDEVILSFDRMMLQRMWSETSYHLQALRSNPRCALKQFETISDREDPGLHAYWLFDIAEDITAPYINVGVSPKVAILREQGTNGHVEMAAAFYGAGFICVDVHMNDLVENRIHLSDFKGLVACSGFSHGDVLGAGQGWAKRILYHAEMRDQFQTFFSRSDTFTLGVANGCQMLSSLKEIIPGALGWPTFHRNLSEQFESRLCLVEIQHSPSIFLKDMEGSVLPIPVAHGEGRVEFESEKRQEQMIREDLIVLRYVDTRGRRTSAYPANPNGSILGITGLTTLDGRATIMMPHPERAFRTVQYSWHPKEWGEDAPWMRLFRNARVWVN